MKSKSLLFQIMVVSLYAFIQFSCGGSRDGKAEYVAYDNDTLTETKIELVTLEPLKDENFKLRGKDPFGEVIELKGEQIIVKSAIFTPSEIEMIIKDNFLIMKNISKYGFFNLFSLPDMKLIKTFGKKGRGPEEFTFPRLCRNTQPDILVTIVESTNDKIYDVLPDGTLRPNNIQKPRSSSGWGAGEYWTLMTNSLLYFAKMSSTGISVFTASGSESKQVNEIQKLTLDLKRKGANYMGDFAINTEQTRLVYAYKYFKIMKFFDMEHHTVRTINFERKEFDENSNYQINGLDSNVTHYWGICAGEKYVYALYSGRTPAQVQADNQKENYYVFIEKYDWNGNPKAKYKLDRWGYFTVDEKNNMLYLVSTNDDDPFFRYNL